MGSERTLGGFELVRVFFHLRLGLEGVFKVALVDKKAAVGVQGLAANHRVLYRVEILQPPAAQNHLVAGRVRPDFERLHGRAREHVGLDDLQGAGQHELLDDGAAGYPARREGGRCCGKNQPAKVRAPAKRIRAD